MGMIAQDVHRSHEDYEIYIEHLLGMGGTFLGGGTLSSRTRKSNYREINISVILVFHSILKILRAGAGDPGSETTVKHGWLDLT